MILFWVPSSVVEGLNEEEGYQKVSERADRILQSTYLASQESSMDQVQDIRKDPGDEVDGKSDRIAQFHYRELTSFSRLCLTGFVIVTVPPTTAAGHLPLLPNETAAFSPSPTLSSRSSLRSANAAKTTALYPSVYADNNDNSRTDASSLLLVSEGGELLKDEFAPDGGMGRDVSGGESARKLAEVRRRKEMEYAWSVPMEEIYSILVYAPSLGQWYGSITVKWVLSLSCGWLSNDADRIVLTVCLEDCQCRASTFTTRNLRRHWRF